MAASNDSTRRQPGSPRHRGRARAARRGLEHLRDELGEATDLTGKLKSKLPIVAGGAASVGFVLAGGVGATMRYFARRGREGTEGARWSLVDSRPRLTP